MAGDPEIVVLKRRLNTGDEAAFGSVRSQTYDQIAFGVIVHAGESRTLTVDLEKSPIDRSGRDAKIQVIGGERWENLKRCNRLQFTVGALGDCEIGAADDEQEGYTEQPGEAGGGGNDTIRILLFRGSKGLPFYGTPQT